MYITNDKIKMHNVRVLDTPISITFGDGQQVKASIVGNVNINDIKSLLINHITLEKVVYVPGAAADLLSIPKQVKQRIEFQFTKDKCYILKFSCILAESNNCNKVFTLHSNIIYTFFSFKMIPQLWHRRFGHLGYGNVSRLQKQRMVDGSFAGDMSGMC